MYVIACTLALLIGVGVGPLASGAMTTTTTTMTGGMDMQILGFLMLARSIDMYSKVHVHGMASGMEMQISDLGLAKGMDKQI